ncbi:LuxR C-terminal-related transcriptional regulator [Sphingomonas sp. A2-49]|uniref:helix-turn-helix domain-containing protein n=1 Tax=Sphingomonas sp. A2-49 TaxID=1391375 RepID=UPI0021CE0501|nr:LuxR C-terminal-related transcriptional regulator [Sphingomonas sp. A2-49]MCU6454108.1 LuxR C-terminal-related transcriptional regulator [Sphingomonas sp. A2-49]
MIVNGTGHDACRPSRDATAAGSDGEGGPHLTPTQIKVLRGVHSGLLNKQIAFDLGIAEATVKVHMTALMRKLNVRNRTQAAVVAQSLTMQIS